MAYLSSKAEYRDSLSTLQVQFDQLFDEKQTEISTLITALNQDDEQKVNRSQQRLSDLNKQDRDIRSDVDKLLGSYEMNYSGEVPKIDKDDSDYVFITFVTKQLPKGLIGLLLAVIFSAAMSSIASELNALASCTTVDFYKRFLGDARNDQHYLVATKFFTLLWGGMALLFAGFASLWENLIEFVNIVGSLFYGTILGIFVVAFFFKKTGSNATFYAAVLAETLVVVVFTLDYYGYLDIAYLWLNLIGCLLVIFFALLFSGLDKVQPIDGELKRV